MTTTARIATRQHQGRIMPAYEKAPPRRTAGLADWLAERRGQIKEDERG